MAKNKPRRDPGAPKRNLSAYILYQNELRDRFMAQNPGMTFGQFSKFTSAMYSELSKREKMDWQARAKADKSRYLQELSTYIPPPGFDARGEPIIVPQKGSKAKVKCTKDAHAPKRNLSAYRLYEKAMREKFKSDNPGMTFGQLSKLTSDKYKSLTPQEKAVWEVRAFEDKDRYLTEMKIYSPPPGYDAQGNLIESENSVKRVKKQRDPNLPNRVLGSFVFFTFEMRPIVMKQFPNLTFVEMGKVLGERWRALSPKEKQRFENIASADKERFNREMQEYTAQKAAALAKTQAEMTQASMHFPAQKDPPPPK